MTVPAIPAETLYFGGVSLRRILGSPVDDSRFKLTPNFFPENTLLFGVLGTDIRGFFNTDFVGLGSDDLLRFPFYGKRYYGSGYRERLNRRGVSYDPKKDKAYVLRGNGAKTLMQRIADNPSRLRELLSVERTASDGSYFEDRFPEGSPSNYERYCSSDVFCSVAPDTEALKNREEFNFVIERQDGSEEWFFAQESAISKLKQADETVAENWLPSDFVDGFPRDGNEINKKVFYFGKNKIFTSAYDDQKKLSSPIKSMYASRRSELKYNDNRLIVPNLTLYNRQDYYGEFIRKATGGEQSFIPNLLVDPAAFKLDLDFSHAISADITAAALREPKQIIFGKEGVYLWVLQAGSSSLAKVSDFKCSEDVEPALSDLMILAKGRDEEEIFAFGLTDVLRGGAQYQVATPYHDHKKIQRILPGENGVLWVLDDGELQRFVVGKNGLAGKSVNKYRNRDDRFSWIAPGRFFQGAKMLEPSLDWLDDGEKFISQVGLYPLVYSGFFPANAMRLERKIDGFYALGEYSNLELQTKEGGPWSNVLRLSEEGPYRWRDWPGAFWSSNSFPSFQAEARQDFRLFGLNFYGSYIEKRNG